MAVKIRLKRMGKIRAPYYRVVVVDSRKKRDGRVIEQIGKYHPKEEPSLIDLESERALYWLGVGAQPSEAVAALLKITGDWQKFKGEPGTEGTLRFAEPKRDKTEIFNEALKESANDPKSEAVTKKSRKMETPAEEAPAAKATPAKDAPAAKEAPAKDAPAAKEAPAKDAPAAKETPKAETPEVSGEKVETPEVETPEVKAPDAVSAPEADQAEDTASGEAPADKADDSSDKPTV